MCRGIAGRKLGEGPIPVTAFHGTVLAGLEGAAAPCSFAGMHKLPSFFVIGTVGMIVTAMLHVFISLVLGQYGAHPVFFGIYPVFMAFLAIGTMQVLAPERVRSGK